MIVYIFFCSKIQHYENHCCVFKSWDCSNNTYLIMIYLLQQQLRSRIFFYIFFTHSKLGCERIPNQSSTSQCKQQMVGYESGRIGSKMVKLRVDVRIHSINFNLSMANTMRILKQSNASRVEQLKNGRVRVGYANMRVLGHSLGKRKQCLACFFLGRHHPRHLFKFHQ